MGTKTKSFDAVAESRRWRDTTSRKLDSMTVKERLVHFQNVRSGFSARKKSRQTGVLTSH